MNSQRNKKRNILIGAGAAAALTLVVIAVALLRPHSAPAPSKPVASNHVVAKPVQSARPGPKFVRFETPTPKIKIHPIGEGFEVINTDPSLTGQHIKFSGITADGKRIPYSVQVPPPVASAE